MSWPVIFCRELLSIDDAQFHNPEFLVRDTPSIEVEVDDKLAIRRRRSSDHSAESGLSFAGVPRSDLHKLPCPPLRLFKSLSCWHWPFSSALPPQRTASSG